MREAGDQILFLHRLQPGGADRSYGIEVGRLAGLPDGVIARAREILTILEGEQLAASVSSLSGAAGASGPARPAARPATTVKTDEQLGFFAATHPIVERLASVDPNAMTPLEALTLLAALSAEAKGAR